MSNFGYGQLTPWDTASDYSVIEFIVKQILGRAATVKLVQVKRVTPNDDAAKAGMVDVLPLVKQVDGNGNATSHGTVYSLLYLRPQAGGNAVVIDPVVDDIGLALVCDRDISGVRASGGKESTPGSFRKFDLADGIYIGGVLMGAPTQKIAFTDDGITLSDKNGNKIEMKPGGIAFTATTLTCNGNIIAGFGGLDQVGLQTHVHTSGAAGSPTSAPTAGS